MNPDVDLSLATKEEMADVFYLQVQVFSILDTGKEGSIDMTQFIKMY